MASLEDAGKKAGAPEILERFRELLQVRPLYEYIRAVRSEIQVLLQVIEVTALSFDSYCPECDDNTTWRVASNAGIPSNFQALLNLGAITDSEFTTTLERVLGRLEFQCARRQVHRAYFNLIVQPGGKKEEGVWLRKIGQWPSLADIAASEIDDYRSLINPEDLAELKRAVGLAAHGIGIGSFVYLRRVFERLVAEAADAAIAAGGSPFTRDEFDRMRMEDKLEAVKDHVPAWMVQNRKLYGILSRGLHELSEATCRQAFAAVKQATIALLEQHAEAAQKKKRAAQAAIELERLAQALNGRI